MNDIVELAFDKFSLTCKVSNLESQLAAVTERAEKAEAQLYIHIAANDELFRLNDEILKRAEQAEARMKRMEDALRRISKCVGFSDAREILWIAEEALKEENDV